MLLLQHTDYGIVLPDWLMASSYMIYPLMCEITNM
uniref:Uncharacterized protein n=1 Tax=Anguilla anguilla TaxID=7936 RepID=A0A0E9V9G5_ANGAN